MAKKKITPSELASQLEWDGFAIADFCAGAFEDANFHNLSLALSAVSVEDYDLACEFIQLEKDQAKAGHLTEELSERRRELFSRLKNVRKG